jgi:hypothetical protein
MVKSEKTTTCPATPKGGCKAAMAPVTIAETDGHNSQPVPVTISTAKTKAAKASHSQTG